MPWSIVRATQFHDFAAMVAGWAEQDGVATIAPLLVQPIAPADVAAVVAEIATAAPLHAKLDVAGREPRIPASPTGSAPHGWPESCGDHECTSTDAPAASNSAATANPIPARRLTPLTTATRPSSLSPDGMLTPLFSTSCARVEGAQFMVCDRGAVGC